MMKITEAQAAALRKLPKDGSWVGIASARIHTNTALSLGKGWLVDLRWDDRIRIRDKGIRALEEHDNG